MCTTDQKEHFAWGSRTGLDWVLIYRLWQVWWQEGQMEQNAARGRLLPAKGEKPGRRHQIDCPEASVPRPRCLGPLTCLSLLWDQWPTTSCSRLWGVLPGQSLSWELVSPAQDIVAYEATDLGGQRVFIDRPGGRQSRGGPQLCLSLAMASPLLSSCIKWGACSGLQACWWGLKKITSAVGNRQVMQLLKRELP